MIADMQAQGFKPAGCIMGEPTGRQVVIAHKGKHSYQTTVPGFVTAEDREIAKLCFDCAEVDPASGAGKVSFGSEAELFHQVGVPTIVCGLGHFAQAHQTNEGVTLDQLAWCERFMRRMADRVFVG
jgi:acetylornithine deacetylase